VAKQIQARRWFVGGRVQGVGFRDFVRRRASALGLNGFARNTEDGRVEVYATGSEQDLSELRGALHQGPQWADVRTVEELEAPIEHHSGFLIR
jgi:acylphosphatase